MEGRWSHEAQRYDSMVAKEMTDNGIKGLHAVRKWSHPSSFLFVNLYTLVRPDVKATSRTPLTLVGNKACRVHPTTSLLDGNRVRYFWEEK